MGLINIWNTLGSRANVAANGFGPLLQRDYTISFRAAEVNPATVIELVAQDLPKLVAARYARFHYRHIAKRPLRVGDVVDIEIRGAGHAEVYCSHMQAHSLTLLTRDDHPEAGRITFSAQSLDNGNVEFRIRSRARSASFITFVGYVLFGKRMQTAMWTDLLRTVVSALGTGGEPKCAVDTRIINMNSNDLINAAPPTIT